MPGSGPRHQLKQQVRLHFSEWGLCDLRAPSTGSSTGWRRRRGARSGWRQCRGLLVHAESDDAQAVYVHLVPEFEPSPTDDMHLVLLVKDVRKTLLR